jgi:hypothetical protein
MSDRTPTPVEIPLPITAAPDGDEVAVISGGGLAYKNDVTSVRRDVKDEARRTRTAVRKMTLDCKKRGDGFACRVDLPEDPE